MDTSEQTMTFEIDPVYLANVLGLTVYCEAGWSDGADFTGGPHAKRQRGRNGTKTQRDDATNKTHDSG